MVNQLVVRYIPFCAQWNGPIQTWKSDSQCCKQAPGSAQSRPSPNAARWAGCVAVRSPWMFWLGCSAGPDARANAKVRMPSAEALVHTPYLTIVVLVQVWQQHSETVKKCLSFKRILSKGTAVTLRLE